MTVYTHAPSFFQGNTFGTIYSLFAILTLVNETRAHVCKNLCICNIIVSVVYCTVNHICKTQF